VLRIAISQFSEPVSFNLNKFTTSSRNVLTNDFYRRVQAAVWNQSMIRTKKVRYGMALKNIMKDDLICILYGCSVPVALRKHVKDGQEEAVEGQARIHAVPGEGEIFYELLGECYVHGMMDGEAIEFQKENDIEPMVFELR
jgi:hypothetical protein